jgi:hypothetical protein
MKFDSLFLKHDYTARNDQRVLQLRFKFGAEGYGAYWMLLEYMAEDPTGYLDRGALGGLSISIGVANGRLSEIVDCCLEIGLLKVCEHGKLFSERLIDHKKNLFDASENGRNGAKKRWGNRGLLVPQCEPNADIDKDTDQDKELKNKYNVFFEKFWESYPKKTGKGAALKSWQKIKDKNATLDLILGALAWQTETINWQKENGQYVPNPATYLNQQRWLDEQSGYTPNRSAKPPIKFYQAPKGWTNRPENE